MYTYMYMNLCIYTDIYTYEYVCTHTLFAHIL